MHVVQVAGGARPERVAERRVHHQVVARTGFEEGTGPGLELELRELGEVEAEALRRHDGVALVGLGPLPPDQVAEVVARCLGTEAVPADVLEWVRTHSDGIPFLVEELLAGLVSTGTLAS